MIRHPRILRPAAFLLFLLIVVGPGMLVPVGEIVQVVNLAGLMVQRFEFPILLLIGFVAVYWLPFYIVAPVCAVTQVLAMMLIYDGASLAGGSVSSFLWFLVFSLAAFMPALAVLQIIVTVLSPKRVREGRS